MDFASRNKWFIDPINADFIHVSSLKQVHYTGKSAFQSIEVVTLGSFGKSLILDSCIQSTERDEVCYHETLVHPTLLLHPTGAKRVFIGGGGEGATSREVLKHKSVQEVIMVDIDQICVELCQKYMSKHGNGAFQDERHVLIFDDAKKRLEESPDEHYDVIILDLADPVDGGPCYQLYTDSFYEMCRRKLTKDGVLVTQSGPCGHLSAHEVFSPIHATLRKVFPGATYMSSTLVTSFMDDYGFNTVLNNASGTINPMAVTPEEIDRRIEERIEGGASALQWYDGITHQRLFHLAKSIRQLCERETRVITKDNYVFMVNANTPMRKDEENGEVEGEAGTEE